MGKHEINAFLGKGVTFEGRLEFAGIVRIDGVFSGEVETGGTLVVGPEAVVTGRLDVGELSCSGKVDAEVSALRKVVLHKTAVFSGNVRVPALVIEEGARMEGMVAMGAESESATALTAG